MIKNYITTAIRSIKKFAGYNIINIIGLTIGLGIFILIISYYDFHKSFDKFHNDYERMYLITAEEHRAANNSKIEAYTNYPLVNILKEEIKEIEKATVCRKYAQHTVKYKDRVFFERNILFSDSNFLKFFNYTVIKGDTKNPLKKPKSVVITNERAKKYFGNKNPIGETIIIDDNSENYIITAVIDECPANSSLRFDLIISISENKYTDWRIAGSTYSFIKLKENIDYKNLEKKFDSLIENKIPQYKEAKIRLSLLPITDIHLNSLHINSGFYLKSAIEFNLILLISIGMIIIVSINFVILTTATYNKRSKETGIRKVMGAARKQLIIQYLSETVIVAMIAFPLALLLFYVLRTPFINTVGENIELNLLNNSSTLLFSFLITLLTGLLSGIYPAILLSSIPVISNFRSVISNRKKHFLARKLLIGFQFLISFILIVLTLLLSEQISMLSKINLGYKRDNIVALVVNPELSSKFELFKNTLEKNDKIVNVATAHNLPFNWSRTENVRTIDRTKEEVEKISSYPCGYDYLELLKLKIIKGRSFSREYSDSGSIIITEKTADYFKLENPIGKTLILDDRNERKTIIGVVKNFHFQHIIFSMKPAVMYLLQDEPFFFLIETNILPDNKMEGYIKRKWDEIYPGYPFEYIVLEDRFQSDLSNSTASLKIFKYITIISVILAAIGLFSIASFTIEQKTKEIGIRKVLGASIPKIINMLILEFFILVVLSILIALPIAIYLANYLINIGWVYKTELNPNFYIISFVITLFTALSSVFFKTFNAATANPIDSIKYE